MDKQLSPLVLGFLLALAGACGGDSKPTKPSNDPVDKDDDNDDDDDESGMDAAARDASGGNNRDAGGGNRDAGGGGNNGNRDSGGGNDGNRDSGGGNATPDAGGGPDLTPVACDTSKAPTIPPLALETVVTGLQGLVYAAQAPDSPEWYLLQQSGQIRVFKEGKLQDAPFLDVSREVSLSSSPIADDERGLLGLAFPPDYATSGRFYVMLTPTSGAGMNRDTVREYKRSAANPLVADPMATRTIVQLDSSPVNHNGGNIMFGPDGMLYVGTGDGGGMCNSYVPGGPQDVGTLFGKVLRLDPNAPAPNFAAAGNPFESGGDPRVLHYGLRNPYRFSFDRLTGDMYLGDVGQGAHEEVSVAPKNAKGVNFGWPAFEGKAATSSTCAAGRRDPFQLRTGAMHVAPIFESNRANRASAYADWISVVGGRVYRGSALPGLRGTYVAGDYDGARMIGLVHCDGATSQVTNILKNPDPNTPNAVALARPSGAAPFRKLTAILEDNEGELYLLANFNTMYKIVARQ